MIFDIFFSQGHFSFLSRRFLTHGISGICSLIIIPRDNVISIDNYGFGIVPKLESLETNKTNITNRISSEPGARRRSRTIVSLSRKTYDKGWRNDSV